MTFSPSRPHSRTASDRFASGTSITSDASKADAPNDVVDSAWDPLDTAVFYLRSARGVVGPVAARAIRQWHVDGRLGPRTPVASGAAGPWRALENVPLLAGFPAPDADAGRDPARELDLAGRCQNRIRRYGLAFPVLVMAAAALGMTAVYGVMVFGLRLFWPGIPALSAGLLSVVPCLLLGGWLGCAMGRNAAAAICGLGRRERRALARSLPWNALPTDLPEWFGHWLYSGDWLSEPRLTRTENYAILLFDRPPPADAWDDLVQRDRDWRHAWAEGPGGMIEVGTMDCEESHQPVWPVWTVGLGADADAEAVTRAGGGVWLHYLAARARARTGLPVSEQDAGWRFWHCPQADGGRALLVTWTLTEQRDNPLATPAADTQISARRHLA